MKKKLFLLLFAILLIIASFLLTAMSPKIVAFAAPALTKTAFFKAVVDTNSLNLRSGPSTKSPVLCTLKSGETVEVYGKIGDWYLVYHPNRNYAGMVYAKYLNTSGQVAPPTNLPAPPQPPAKPKPQPTIAPTKAPAAKASPVTTKPPVPPAPPAQTAVPSITATKEESELLSLVNEARKTAGVSPLQFDTGVLKTARLKARDMVDKNYFSHQSPTYGSPFDMMRQFGISFKTAGENIAGNSVIKDAFQAWMKSEGHKKNILNGNFNYTGIGIEASNVYGKVLVQQFIGK